MSILTEIKEKAKDLIKLSEPYVTRNTNVYDASKNRIIVAGFPLDGIMDFKVSSDVILKQETGIDHYYTTFIQQHENRTLMVTLLPTATCLDVLRSLALKQQTTKGWFNISVHENDRIVNVYRAEVLSLPEIGASQEADNREVLFGIKSVSTSVAVIDQPTQTESESYGQYSNQADRDNLETIVDEDTGQIQQGTVQEDGSFKTFPLD